MKSSLKFTAIALLLGGVLHVQNLNAATTATVSLSTLEELSNPTGRFSNPTNGPKAFAACLEQLATQSIDPETIRRTLDTVIPRSSVSPEFLKNARIAASNNVRALMTYCEGVKMGSMTGDTVISELRIEHQTLVSKQQTRTDALTQQIPSLQDEVNELSDENDLLQSEVCDLSSDLDQAQQTLKSLHAFAQPSEQSVVVPVATLPAYTVIKQELSTLSVAEQVYFLKVRSKLTSRDQLTTSLTELETLLKFRQMMAITSPTAENLENAAFLVDVIPQVRAIAPIIGSYLQSITGDILKINATATSSGWFAAPQLGAVQTLQLKELEIRKNLSYAIFDALFGAMVKTTTVPAAIPFATDPSAANVLASKVQTLHATLPATIPSQKLIVKDNGLISVAGDADYATEVNLTLQFMIDLQQLTVDFLKQTLGAQTLLNTTLNTSAMIQATELVQAKTILCPPPPPPALTALVTDSPLKTATITATNQSTQDDSSDSDEDSFVDGTTVKEDTTA